MSNRARRPGGPSKPLLLEALENARQMAIAHGASQKSYHSETYRLCQALHKAIDALAADVTGDPEYFHAKPHGGSYKASP